MIINKKTIITKFAKTDKDVGSVEVQIGLLSSRINQISTHLRTFPKDKHSQVGLQKLVGKKRKLETYLKRTDKASFENIIKQLNK